MLEPERPKQRALTLLVASPACCIPRMGYKGVALVNPREPGYAIWIISSMLAP